MKRSLISGLLVLIAATTQGQDLIETLNQDTLIMNLTDNPMTCLLTDTELAKRKNVLQRQIFSNVKKVEEADDGYFFHFDDSENLLSDLFYYILAEKECCPFFQQDVSIGPDNSGIVWKISGEDGIKKMLREMFEKIEFPE